jgi:succinyl-diaminopimelate desuccinylase
VARILAAMVDRRGKVQIPGFYDDVVPLDDRQRKEFAALPLDEAEYFAAIGVSGSVGEEGYTLLERRWARPTCDVCGLWGGYQGDGAKTVLPAKAGAKFSFRLVPHQSPEKITAALRRWLPEVTPPGVTVELVDWHGSPAVVVSRDSPYVAAAVRALEHAFGCPPVFTREGGSIPIVAAFHETLKADTLLTGWGQDDDNAHSPNEKFSLADFHRGIRASARLWEELGKLEVRR